MKVDQSYKSFEEPENIKKTSKSNVIIVIFMVVLTSFSVALLISLKLFYVATRPGESQLDNYSGHFPKHNNREIPLKCASGSQNAKNKVFITTILFKAPQDLIENQEFLRDFLMDFVNELEDSCDRYYAGKKIVKVEIFNWERKYRDVVTIYMKIEFIRGMEESFHELILPIMGAAYGITDEFDQLVDDYRQFGERRRDVDDDDNESEFEESDENFVAENNDEKNPLIDEDDVETTSENTNIFSEDVPDEILAEDDKIQIKNDIIQVSLT